jgi:hypothetical protein
MTADHNAAAREIAHQGIPAAVIFGVPDEHELARLRLRLAEAVGEALRAAEDRARQEGRRAGLEEAAKVVEATPTTILQFWDRPGGPPGNGYRATTGADFAAAIRALATGKDRG